MCGQQLIVTKVPLAPTIDPEGDISMNLMSFYSDSYVLHPEPHFTVIKSNVGISYIVLFNEKLITY